MDKNEVSIAFEILLKELETVLDSLSADAATASAARDYDKAGQLIEDAKRLTDFRDRVKGLQSEWETLFSGKAPQRRRATRRNLTKLTRGPRTPEDAFEKPILEALVALGGSAPMKNVLDAVGKRMADTLNRYDHERLPSEPHEVRWRNTAEWCRNRLVRNGLLAAESRRGVWEITNKGRATLPGMKACSSIVQR